MTLPMSGIDHLVILVEDLDAAAATYARLGFMLSPRGVHSAAMGTANHTLMLGQDYFEVLSVLRPTERNLRWQRRQAAHGEHVAGLALVTPDAAALRARWRDAGFSPGEVVDFARPVERAGRAPTEARFQTVSLPPESVPGMAVFGCAQLTRDAVWLPELMMHANGATAIERLVVAVNDPAGAAPVWQRALCGAAIAPVDGGMRLLAGAHAIDLLNPATAAAWQGAPLEAGAERGIGIGFVVSDLGRCAALLRARGVAFHAAPGRLRTSLAERAGGILEFCAGCV
jgi:catechol 2,3-dioxygenase-like lactoylglutathione lyase family enzyme